MQNRNNCVHCLKWAAPRKLLRALRNFSSCFSPPFPLSLSPKSLAAARLSPDARASWTLTSSWSLSPCPWRHRTTTRSSAAPSSCTVFARWKVLKWLLGFLGFSLSKGLRTSLTSYGCFRKNSCGDQIEPTKLDLFFLG